MNAPPRFLRIVVMLAHTCAPLAVLLAIRLSLSLPALYQSAVLFADAPRSAFRTVVNLIQGGIALDGAVFASAFIGFAFLKGAQHRVMPAATALFGPLQRAAWWMVPAAAVGLLATALGVDVWLLPHRSALAAPHVVVDGRVDAWRIVAKAVVAYAPAAVALALDAVRSAPRVTVRRRWLVPAISTAIWWVGLAVLLPGFLATRERIRPVVSGDVMASFALPRLADGDGVPAAGVQRSADLAGRVLVIDFWASWCVPCRRGIPELARLAAAYRAQDVVFLGIAREPEAPAASLALWATLRPGFDTLLDEHAYSAHGYGDRMAVQSLPATFVIRRDGTVQRRLVGYSEEAVLRAEIDAALRLDRP